MPPAVPGTELQLQTDSGRSPLGGFGAPKPQESGAGQRSFVSTRKRPNPGIRLLKLTAVKRPLAKVVPV
jgi:hypothetical protein